MPQAHTHRTQWSEADKYTLFGTLFGLCFPIGSIAFLYATGELHYTPGLIGILRAAHRNPLLYVIDTAPLFLGLFARIAGIRQDGLQAVATSLEEQVALKTESLRHALEEANRANETIAHMAEHDTLTGLLNRRRFQKELDRWTLYGARFQRPISVLFIDLDQFKTVNDAFGHAAGDHYLAEVGKILAQCTRATDIVARWGGDEFAALLPETGRQGAIEVAEKLIRAAAAKRITLNEQTLTPSFSIGIALFPDHGSQFGDLIMLADAAMYQAKHRGSGLWQLYSASQEEMQLVQEHGRWERRIRKALENDQFILFYQPLLDLRSGKTSGYEALLRMEDPDGQLISPGLFLESAERFGLAIPIDRMVIRKAIRKVRLLGTDGLQISLNLSQQALQDEGLADYIAEMMQEKQFSGGRLGIEITEAVALQNLHATRELSVRLKGLGITVILDDFSMGAASLRYLGEVPIALVKLDGALARNLKDDASTTNKILITNLVRLAHDSGIEIAAKHIEDPDLLSVLAKLGVDYAQGFAVGRPMESIEQIHEIERLAES